MGFGVGIFDKNKKTKGEGTYLNLFSCTIEIFLQSDTMRFHDNLRTKQNITQKRREKEEAQD